MNASHLLSSCFCSLLLTSIVCLRSLYPVFALFLTLYSIHVPTSLFHLLVSPLSAPSYHFLLKSYTLLPPSHLSHHQAGILYKPLLSSQWEKNVGKIAGNLIMAELN